jgi:hypothetical protein
MPAGDAGIPSLVCHCHASLFVRQVGVPFQYSGFLSCICRLVQVALRRSIPAQNAYVRGAQSRLEGIQFKLRIPQRKPWGAIGEDALAATATMANVEQVSFYLLLAPRVLWSLH